MARSFRNFAALSLFLISNGAEATTVRSFLNNSKGVAEFKAKSYYPAYQNFLKALEQDPLNPVMQLNLGLVFEANEELDKAESAYRGALLLLPVETAKELRFAALFNLGGVFGKQQKYDQALAAYQEALSLNPQSKETKTNIELLWQGGGGQGKDAKDKDKDKDQKNKGKGQGQDGKDQQPDDKKDGKNKGEGEPQEPDPKKKPQPKPFDSQDLSKEDVKKILDEIKNQEQAIRAQEYERNVKESPPGKDW